MTRAFFAAVLVTVGLLAPAAGASAARVAAPLAPPVVLEQAGAPLTTVAIAAKKDACASRSKKVTTLKRRYRIARTKQGRARTLRLLNAARRSLKRCRSRKPAPESTTPSPAPAPVPSPAPAPMPVPAPGPGPTPDPSTDPGPAPAELRLTVNDGPGGAFAPTAPLVLAVTGLSPAPSGWTYGLSVRVPEAFTGPPLTCSRQFDSERFAVTSTVTGAAVTARPAKGRWCEGSGSVFVWAAPADTPWDPTIKKIASLSISVPAP